MKRKFIKMEGAGNDYIYFDCLNEPLASPETLAVRLSDRHMGIGGDGIVLICPSDIADAKMRMFNADGSEGKMCGNAIRCVAKYLYDKGLVKKMTMTIDTLSGIKTVSLVKMNGEVQMATVDMGPALLSPASIPAKFGGDRIVSEPITVGGEEYRITCVSMGNPHGVVFCNPDSLDLEVVGPLFEHHEKFPERLNTEFIKVIDRNTLKMRVWERGSGETWACGTGACAAAVAAVENGFCPKGEEITVKLRGGDLVIRYTDETVYLTGGAEKIYDGVVEL